MVFNGSILNTVHYNHVNSRGRQIHIEWSWLVKVRSLPSICLILSPHIPLTVSFIVGSQADSGFNRAGRCPRLTRDNRDLAMISLDFNFNILTRDLSHYLENQVKVGLFGSGVGLSLVLGFSAAYTCYYLISVAKVSKQYILK